MLWKLIKITKYTFVAFLTWLLVIYITTSAWGYSKSTRDITKAQQAPLALVLGTSPYSATGVQNEFFEHRMNAAYDVYNAGLVSGFVVSGDNREKDYNEPKAMREALEARGIPPGSITEDDGGIRTLDSVLRMRYTFGQEKFIIITQGFHLNRALMIAAGHGIEAYGFRANNTDNMMARASMLIREMFARQKMMYDIIIDTEVNFK